MDTAEQLVLESEPLSWAEICARYPDQFVCLVDIAHPAPRSPEITSARVVGHGVTDDEAFEPIRDLDQRYPRFSVRFTGVCSEPLIRPAVVVIDDEDYPSIRR
jgi:hypothetical protein